MYQPLYFFFSWIQSISYLRVVDFETNKLKLSIFFYYVGCDMYLCTYVCMYICVFFNANVTIYWHISSSPKWKRFANNETNQNKTVICLSFPFDRFIHWWPFPLMVTNDSFYLYWPTMTGQRLCVCAAIVIGIIQTNCSSLWTPKS